MMRMEVTYTYENWKEYRVLQKENGADPGGIGRSVRNQQSGSV